jgi:hypothetical protein
VSLLRRLRIAAPAQLRLGFPEHALGPVERWWALPHNARESVLEILARMIAAGVVELDEEVNVNDAQP